MKIVINTDFGGFSLSKDAMIFLGRELEALVIIKRDKAYHDKRLSSIPYKETNSFYPNIERTDTKLVECVEKLGKRASGSVASLTVVEIPDEMHWEICEYDGSESIIYSKSPIHHMR